MSGVVYDANGAVIVGATVGASNGKGEKFETKTNDEGIYLINLLPQSYTVSVEQSGFIKYTIVSLHVINSTYGKLNRDMVLEVDTRNTHEPCGYGGADCQNLQPIETAKVKVSNTVFQKPVKKITEETK